MGGRELLAPAGREPPLGYHSSNVETLTTRHELGVGQCQVDSLTGAVASEKVTEAPKGLLSMVGNHARECKGIRRLDCERDISSRYESRA